MHKIQLMGGGGGGGQMTEMPENRIMQPLAPTMTIFFLTKSQNFCYFKFSLQKKVWKSIMRFSNLGLMVFDQLSGRVITLLNCINTTFFFFF